MLRHIRILFILLLIIVPSFSQDEQSTGLNDTTKMSGRIADLLTDPENVDKMDKIAGVVGKGAAIFKHRKEIMETLKNLDFKKSLKGKLKGLVFKYTNAKSAPIIFIKQATDDISTILTRMDERINQWRTTLPTLQAFGTNALMLANDTYKAIGDFKVNDLWDLDRKWSRNLEGSIRMQANLMKGMSGWMIGRYESVNGSDYGDVMSAMLGLFLYSPEKAMSEGINPENQDLVNLYVYTEAHQKSSGKLVNIGTTTLLTSAEALMNVGLITKESHEISKENGITTTKEHHELRVIETYLNASDKTYKEELELMALIKSKRAGVEIQTAKLEQLNVNMSVLHTRMEQLALELKALTSEDINSELDFILGEDILEDYKSHRESVFGK